MVDLDTAPAMPAGRNRHLGSPGAARTQAPKPRRGVVAQHRPSTAREHCGEAMTVLRRSGIANGIGTAIEAVQTLRGDRPSDRGFGVAKPQQLLMRDNPGWLPASRARPP